MDITEILARLSEGILNPLIVLLLAIAFLVFFWGLFQFIQNADSEEGRETGKRTIVWGIVGIVIMISAYGILAMITGTFGISRPF